MAKIKICKLVIESGLTIRQNSAVTQAPSPKKKIKNPGITNSRRKRVRPIMNQNSSGLESMVSIIVLFLNH
jgi:hypothetical protein